MKKTLSLFLVLVITLTSVFSVSAIAQDNLIYAPLVTKEMCDSSYWYDKGIIDSDRVLMTADEISKINQAAIDGKGTNVIDIFGIKGTYNADSSRQSLAGIAVPTRSLYINGELIDNAAYFANISNAIKASGYTGSEAETRFAVCTKRCDITSIPTSDIIGYSAEDPDNEYTGSALNVNEPFAIRQKCDIDGETFYWGYSYMCSGWVNAENLAICDSREQWIDACKTDPSDEDVLVVIEDKIVTEPSIRVPYSSEVKLTFGTVLKLVPEKEIPESIGERATWFNHVVYLPTRNAEGRFEKKAALISMHNKVSIGFMPFTQKNILDVAFSCLGNRYGWGGMLDSMDCSLYTRNIYRCFGFIIPRNTTWQQLVPDTLISLDGMTEVQKGQLVETLPIGALLYFPGHTMMYTGTADNISYVISVLGSVVDVTGEIAIKKIYSVSLNPLIVRRGNGRTWLDNLSSVVLFSAPIDIEQCDISTAKNEDGSLSVSVVYNGKELYEGVNYTVSVLQDGTVMVTGINNFGGEALAQEEVPAQNFSVFQKLIDFFNNILDILRKIFVLSPLEA